METEEGTSAVMDNLEKMEIRQPEALSLEDYAKMMLYYLHQKSPMQVIFSWKRMKEPNKSSPVIQQLVQIADALSENNFSKVCPAFNTITWPESLLADAGVVHKKLQALTLAHIRKLYDVISRDRFAALLGVDPDSIEQLVLGSEYFVWTNDTKQFINVAPLLPSEGIDSEEETDWTNEMENLPLISDIVWSLSKKPFNPDELVK